MVDQLNSLWNLGISFPITTSFRQQARAYASQYFTRDTHERIYLNTLALLVADTYFRVLNFQTNLNSAKRWNAACRLWSEANELELVELGNLECRVITAGQQTIFLPPETWCDRIGYLFLEIASSEREAMLVGFLPALHHEILEEEVALAELKSMDEMVDYLVERETSLCSKTSEVDNPTPELVHQKFINLGKWLNNIYEEPEWEPAVRNLSTIARKKKIQLAGYIFEMQLSVSHSSDEAISVIVTVQCENVSLPLGMQVNVPDESGTYTETVTTLGNHIIRISLEFSLGEKFWVELQMGETSIIEYFTT